MNRPVRIVIGADTYPPDTNGAARFTARLAAGSAGREHEVHVVAPSCSRTDPDLRLARRPGVLRLRVPGGVRVRGASHRGGFPSGYSTHDGPRSGDPRRPAHGADRVRGRGLRRGDRLGWYFPNEDAILAELVVRHLDRGTWTQADQLDLSAGSLEAPLSQDLLDTIDRHGRTRVGQVRDLLAQHPDVRVRDLDTAAELIVFPVELDTRELMAEPRTTAIETFEAELVDMVARYLRGERSISGSGSGSTRSGRVR